MNTYARNLSFICCLLCSSHLIGMMGASNGTCPTCPGCTDKEKHDYTQKILTEVSSCIFGCFEDHLKMCSKCTTDLEQEAASDCVKDCIEDQGYTSGASNLQPLMPTVACLTCMALMQSNCCDNIIDSIATKLAAHRPGRSVKMD